MIKVTSIILPALFYWFSTFQVNVPSVQLSNENTSLRADSTDLKKGDKFPDFTFLDTNGKEVKISDMKGKYVYIDVWASWCYPCRKEYPALKALRDRLKDKSIEFVGISCDTQEIRWKGALRDEKMDGTQWILRKNDRSFMSAFKVGTVPRYILVDKKGKILNPDIERPSNPKTEETINALKNL